MSRYLMGVKDGLIPYVDEIIDGLRQQLAEATRRAEQRR